MTLSQNRADAIKEIFSQASFFPEKISTVDGRGELLLNIVDETNPSVIRALNRRVDIVISYPEKNEEIIEEEEKEKNKIILDNVLFITGYSYLTRRSKKTLDNVAEALKMRTNPKATKEYRVPASKPPTRTSIKNSNSFAIF